MPPSRPRLLAPQIAGVFAFPFQRDGQGPYCRAWLPWCEMNFISSLRSTVTAYGNGRFAARANRSRSGCGMVRLSQFNFAPHPQSAKPRWSPAFFQPSTHRHRKRRALPSPYPFLADAGSRPGNCSGMEDEEHRHTAAEPPRCSIGRLRRGFQCARKNRLPDRQRIYERTPSACSQAIVAVRPDA